jgi:hypothetical protein
MLIKSCSYQISAIALVAIVAFARAGVAIDWNITPEGVWANKCAVGGGSSYMSVYVQSSECYAAFLARTACTHFFHNGRNGSECWLRRDKPLSRDSAGPYAGNGSVCGILNKFTWNPDSAGESALRCNFPGNDIGDEQVSSAECPGACADNAGCTHYVHTNGTDTEQPTCWLKGGDVSKDSATSGDHDLSICGILDPIAQSWSIEKSNTGANVSNELHLC